MKEIKAYIRTSVVEKTVQALKEKGCPGIITVTVHPVKRPFGARHFIPKYQTAKIHSDTTKIWLLCEDKDVDILVNTIIECAYTGRLGDGVIFVSNVEQAIKIRIGFKENSISELSDLAGKSPEKAA